MDIFLIADTYYPRNDASAQMMSCFAKELKKQGFNLIVIVPDWNLKSKWSLESHEGIDILRLKCMQFRDINFILRAIAEILLPIFMYINYLNSPLNKIKVRSVIWLAPSIFLSLFVKLINKKAINYLILRDVFPEWIADLGLIKRKSLAFKFFKYIEYQQYSIADVIGIQSIGNLPYFGKLNIAKSTRVEILYNWQTWGREDFCKIDLSKTKIKNKTIFLYAGNMGVAQGGGYFN